MRPLWPSLAGWWPAFTSAAVIDAVMWAESAYDQAWRAGTELAFFPLLLLAVYSCLLAWWEWRDRRRARRRLRARAAPTHPAQMAAEARGLDAELAAELERRVRHHG